MLSELIQANLIQTTGEARHLLAPAQFSAGWLYGLSGLEERDTILDCYEPSEKLTNTLYDAMDAFIAGDNRGGLTKYNEAKPLFMESFSSCKEFGRQHWVNNIKHMEDRVDWPQLREAIYQENKFAIDLNVDLELREWAQGEYFNSGMFVGRVFKIFYDNIPSYGTSSAEPVLETVS